MLTPPLTDRDYLTSLLTKAGIRPVASAGQHFLIAEEVIEATLMALENGPQQITELGAGPGALTEALLQNGYHVRAIERDNALAHINEHHLPTKARQSLELIVKDLRDVNWSWPTDYQLVGNIPYNLSGLIIRRITKLSPTPNRAVLLVQAEVGERLTATPPDMQLLSLAVSLWGEAHVLMKIPASCFWPAPQVNSALVLLLPHATNKEIAQREDILAFAKPLFQLRRKQIGGSLQKTYQLSSNAVSTVLAEAGATTEQRPQELTVAQWQNLHKSVTSHK
ncbi:MAG: 16S rRNA (adenine(1518)-N(6)/adenine(1519)-N(6))-dimethyltransferase RsmA [Candidatus Andersenbacteria bacterium]